MCGIACGITTLVLGAILLFTSSFVGFGLMDGFIENTIANEVALHDDTIQLERFIDIPFPLNLTIRVFNITNREEVLVGGVPVVNEVGPYIYKLYQTRSITDRDAETLEYHRTERMEFDAESSYPHAEDDVLTIANVPYHAILQVAESEYPELLNPLSLVLNGVFGELNSPVVSVSARALFLDGLPLCASPGALSGLACTAIRAIAATSQNIMQQPDGTLLFSILGYRNGLPSPSYKIHRGVEDARDVGRIISFDHSYRLRHWPEGEEGSIEEHSPNMCNMINGTDSGLYPPFVQKENSIFAFNSDICRSVELRYQYDFELFDVPVVRYSAKEWHLDNHQGCFCLNVTRGVTAPDGCLLTGALELYSCVGAFLVVSNPHFLYADPAYQNGVIGMTPNEEIHQIFLDLEPNTGIVIRGMKRAQFNVFMRSVPGIIGTDNLTNVLTPIFWVEEGLMIPEEYLNELKDKLLSSLRLVDILVPVAVAASCVVLLLGIGLTVRARINRPLQNKAN